MQHDSHSHTARNRRTRIPARTATLGSVSMRDLALITLVALALILIAWITGSRENVGLRSQPFTVSAGDSHWTIAQTHPIKGHTTAETVAAIVRANGLSSETLQPGDVLLVPSASRHIDGILVASR